MDRHIQTLTNLAFLGLCIIGIALGVRSFLKPTPVLVPGGLNSLRASAPRPSTPPPPYQAGEPITLDNVNFAGASHTLLLVVRKGCRFCDESMPFYKRLGEDAEIARRTRLVIVAPDEEVVSREELDKQRVRVDQIVRKPLAGLKVRGTPTAIVVDKSGRVEKVMVGRLDEKQQQELMTALKGSSQR